MWVEARAFELGTLAPAMSRDFSFVLWVGKESGLGD